MGRLRILEVIREVVDRNLKTKQDGKSTIPISFSAGIKGMWVKGEACLWCGWGMLSANDSHYFFELYVVSIKTDCGSDCLMTAEKKGSFSLITFLWCHFWGRKGKDLLLSGRRYFFQAVRQINPFQFSSWFYVKGVMVLEFSVLISSLAVFYFLFF